MALTGAPFTASMRKMGARFPGAEKTSRRKVRRIGYDKIETFTLKRRAPVIGADGLAALFKRKGAQILPRACRGALPDIHAGHAAAFIAQQEQQ